jgi:L-2-hydroxyglutarate oxidase LhgO
VVGLAIARSLSKFVEVVVLEAENSIGTGISSRNSEVIHAGIYYTPGSLKSLLCQKGRDALYARCEEAGIPFNKCGKLIVATSQSQHGQLRQLKSVAHTGGVRDLKWLTPEDVARLEPELRCTGALLSPSTGIVDSHALMQSLLGEAEANGTLICVGARVLGGRIQGREIGAYVYTEDTEISARYVVNAAGLQAQNVSASIVGLPAPQRAYYAKGSYFRLRGASPFSRLVYPAPDVHCVGLGVHATLDLSGSCRFGPDVEWIDNPQDFDMDPGRAKDFYRSIRTYWPALADDSLEADYAGIRPKLQGPNCPARDFSIALATPGVVNLFGIESPGLTASMAIGDFVADLLGLRP